MVKLKNFVIYLFFSYGLSLLFLIISTLIFAYTNINDRYLNAFVFSSTGISIFISSILCMRKIKEKGLVNGLMFGLIFIALIYLITALLYRGFFVSNTLLIYVAVSSLTGMTGGMLGVNI